MGVLQVCLVGALWGSGGLAFTFLLRDCSLSVVTVSAWRTGTAAVALWIWAGLRGQIGDLRHAWSLNRRSSVITGVGTAASQMLYFGAIVEAGVSIATVISLGLAPVLLTIREACSARRAPSRGRTAAVVVALIGLAAVSLAGGSSVHSPNAALGVTLAAGSAATYALATAAARSGLTTGAPSAMATLSFTVGAIVQLPAMALVGPPYITANPKAVGWLLFLGVIILAFGYSLFYSGLAKVPSSVAVLGTLLQPAIAAITAAIVLGERLGAAGVLGTALVLAAVAGIGLDRSDTAISSRTAAEAPPGSG